MNTLTTFVNFYGEEVLVEFRVLSMPRPGVPHDKHGDPGDPPEAGELEIVSADVWGSDEHGRRAFWPLDLVDDGERLYDECRDALWDEAYREAGR